MEAGTNYPEMDKLLQLCDLFHTSLDDLMRGSVHVKENDTERYDEHMNRSTCPSRPASPASWSAGLNALLEAFGWPDNLQTVALLSCIVIGVVILVVGGLNHSEFKRRNPFHRAAVLLRHARSVWATLPDAHRRRRGSHPHRRHHANSASYPTTVAP